MNASLPVPNDDPACHCLLEPQTIPDGFAVVEGGVGRYARVRVAYDLDCPHHGGIVRSLQSDLLRGGFGIGWSFAPARPADPQ